VNILAIDTSTETLALALSVSGNIWQVQISAGARHSELLMDWIDKLTVSAGLQPVDLDLVLCMKGPGSFTGLRIGYAAAKGLSASLGIPVKAVPTLDCIAVSNSTWPGITAPVLDAKKNSFFTAFYKNGIRITDYMDASIQEIASLLEKHNVSKNEPLFVSGPGSPLFLSQIKTFLDGDALFSDPFPSRGRALEMLYLQEMLQIRDDYDKVISKEGLFSGPLYIRKSDAELNLEI